MCRQTITCCTHISHSGPQPGWDPDIVAALEAAETSNTVEDELEDDFVTMVRLGESTLAVLGVCGFFPTLLRLTVVRLDFQSMSLSTWSKLTVVLHCCS